VSGGSYNYAYCQMLAGETDEFAQLADRFVGHLRDLEARIEAGKVEAYDRPEGSIYAHARPPTEAEKALWLMAVSAARGRFESAQRKLAEVQGLMVELADLAHAIEWRESGDTGDEGTARDCVKWMRKRLDAIA
jgi:hypothetical protein